MSQKLLKINPAYYLIVLGVVATLLTPVSFIFLLIFPFWPLVNVKKVNFLVNGPVLFALNILAGIVNAVILDTFNLPVTLTFIVLLTLIESLALLKLRPKRLEFHHDLRDNKYLYLLYFIFLLAIISRVISVAHLHVPILHDPQAHAFWANKILQEKAIDYFYSPGLHVWGMLANAATNLSIARSIHFVTNFFSAFSVLMWGLAAYAISKQARIGVWIALLALISPIPQNLFFLAGKNSFVMSTPFIALVLLFLINFYQNRSLVNSTILFLALIGVGLIHYPAYAYAVGFVLLFILSKYTLDNIDTIRSAFLRSAKVLLILTIPAVASLIFIGANVALTTKENVSIAIISSRPEAKAYHSLAVNTEEVPVYKSLPKARAALSLNSPLSVLKNFGNEFLAYTRMASKDIGILLLGAMSIGVYFVMSYKSKSKELANLKMASLVLLLTTILIIIGLGIYPISKLSTTGDTGLLLLPLVLSLPLGWLLTHISKKRLLEIFVIITFAIGASYITFNLFRSRSSASFVDKNDVAAYDWIEHNIQDSEKFIGLSQLDPRRSSVVFPVDGSVWLPVFTNNQIATPFQELRFASIESHINYEYFQRLGADNITKVDRSVEYFLDNNYGYIYVDGPAAYESMGIERLIKEGLADTVYANPSVTIVRLLD